MKVDFEFLRWLASESEEVVKNVSPLVARLLGLEQQQVLDFVNYISDATDAILNAIELFVNFPVSFGADGNGLTDSNGNLCPDCPDCDGHEPVLFALKAQALV